MQSTLAVSQNYEHQENENSEDRDKFPVFPINLFLVWKGYIRIFPVLMKILFTINSEMDDKEKMGVNCRRKFILCTIATKQHQCQIRSKLIAVK